jgi:hypothetical protein
MKKWTKAIVLVLAGLSISCKEQLPEIQLPEPLKRAYGLDTLQLNRTEYHDRVLGALVGSAIGDAMGASTEMWHRKDIQRQYGYIKGLTAATRVQSPEGTWEHNLNAGATTDDTRWKLLMGKYIIRHKTSRNATVFADYIINYYQSVASELGNKDILIQTEALDAKLEQLDWIKEWARVALAYQQGTKEYLNARDRFYGGEMSCAGMLYTPMFGLVTPNPEAAYKEAFDHTLFDLGYARDIAALVSGMTNMALQTKNIDSIINTAIFIDPVRYGDSRLVGRISADIAITARKNVWLSRELEIKDDVDLKDSLGIVKPVGYVGNNTEWLQQDFIYTQLEKDEKAIPFHAGEIWQILITALEFGEGDFEKTMQFIVNYGRDNDTVAAVAGMILGAKDGYSGLPESLREEVLLVNKEQMGIDLEALATMMVDELYD